MENKKFVSLDFLRAISALIVALGHSRFVMLVPSKEVVDLNYLDRFIYFITGFGSQAVIVFFVLSGFFIARSIDNSIERDSFTIKKYFIDRYFRLSIVAVPAVFLTFLLDKLSFLLFNSEQLYFKRFYWLDSTSYSIQTFLGNIFYLQKLFFNSFGSNGPLWSLAYEWWFYVLAPFLIAPLLGKKKMYIILFLLLALFLIFTRYTVLIYFIYWFFGSIVYFMLKKDIFVKITSKKLLLLFLFLVFISASLVRLKFVDKKIGDCLISISVALLIFSLVKNDILKENKVITFFTNISYSLYTIHLPVIIFIVSIFPYFKFKLQPTLGNSLLNLLVLSITIFISWIFYLVFEKNTNRIKKVFIDFFNKFKIPYI